RLHPDVERPTSAVVLITVDGLAAHKFNAFLADGDLPNIQHLFVDRGVRVCRAVGSQPNITYAGLVTMLTGRYAGHHGILGNKWFDRYALVHRDYTTIATYRMVDADSTAPTLFEHLAPAPGVSIQCAFRRGASRTIDNWASSGIRWFFGAYQAVDALIPLRMELIGQSANDWRRWPRLIHAYMPGVDEIAHQRGCDSPEYRAAVINVDRQVGRLHEAVADAGMTERTYFVLTSDHGHLPVPPGRFLDVADWLRRNARLRVQTKPALVGSFERRRQHYERIEAVVVVGGDRRAVVHLPGWCGWSDKPGRDRVATLLSRGGLPIWQNQAVAFALIPDLGSSGERIVHVHSRQGQGCIRRHRDGTVVEYTFENVSGDVVSGAFAPGRHDAATWLAKTVDSRYPDFVVQAVEQFDSPRAGDAVLLAAPGWDFSRGNRGGHGGTEADEMLVPLIIAGPGIPAGGTINHIRQVDLAPTLLGLLDEDAASRDPRSFDGVDRSDAFRPAATGEGKSP
ncbi:MAG: alkaline phosphatase family protein, partial [bacterium]|nr:alkaline phosphatase family protein [bacterium]